MKLIVRFNRVGNRLVAFPVNREAKLFAELVAAPSVPGESLRIAKELGFELEVEPGGAGGPEILPAYMDRDRRV